MNKTISLKEWLKENPGKSVNDYFRLHPGKIDQTTSSYTNTNVYPNPISKGFNINQLLGIILCIIGIVAFFLPWFHLKLLGFNIASIKGYSLPDIADGLQNLESIFSGKKATSGLNMLHVLYLLPPLYSLYVLGEFQLNKSLKLVCGLSLLVCFVIASYRIFDEIPLNDIIHNIGIGFYLTLAVIVILLFKG